MEEWHLIKAQTKTIKMNKNVQRGIKNKSKARS